MRGAGDDSRSGVEIVVLHPPIQMLFMEASHVIADSPPTQLQREIDASEAAWLAVTEHLDAGIAAGAR